MLILGIDTCTETIDAAIVENGATLAKRRGSAPKQQLTKLMPFIEEIFKESSHNLGEIDLIAVTTGPGSFTGIRLGLATAKTLAQLRNIKLAAVNTLDAIAAGCEEDGIIIPSMDARKSEIFFSVYEKQGRKISRIEPYHKKSIEKYLDFIDSLKYENPVIPGSVFGRYKDLMSTRKKQFRTVREELWTPRGEITAVLGEEIYNQGKTVDFTHLEADYMRLWEATPPKPLI